MKKDIIMTIIMMIIFIAIFIGMMIFVSNRNQKIEEGKIDIIYQYGGDI